MHKPTGRLPALFACRQSVFVMLFLSWCVCSGFTSKQKGHNRQCSSGRVCGDTGLQNLRTFLGRSWLIMLSWGNLFPALRHDRRDDTRWLPQRYTHAHAYPCIYVCMQMFTIRGDDFGFRLVLYFFLNETAHLDNISVKAKSICDISC